VAERGLQIHAFVFDKQKEACVRLVETTETETEIKSARSANAAAVGGEPACTGSCGGLGLCKKAQEKEKEYAF
jgi:hypothetical protein